MPVYGPCDVFVAYFDLFSGQPSIGRCCSIVCVFVVCFFCFCLLLFFPFIFHSNDVPINITQKSVYGPSDVFVAFSTCLSVGAVDA